MCDGVGEELDANVNKVAGTRDIGAKPCADSDQSHEPIASTLKHFMCIRKNVLHLPTSLNDGMPFEKFGVRYLRALSLSR